MKFTEMSGIDQRVLKALDEIGFVELTDIQAQTIPHGLEGKDIIAQAMTGSGKTAAFGVPAIQKVVPKAGVQVLVLTPTRELAEQVTQEMVKFARYCSVHVAAVYGGVSIENQFHTIRHSEIIVGTPGRILDHMQRSTLSLGRVKVLVLDEGDRMLDMGFIDDITRIISQCPKERQTLMFSATFPEEIERLAHRYMRNPLRIKTQLRISKHLLKHVYYDIRREEKPSVLLHLIEKEKPSLAIIFCATRRGTDFVERFLQNNGVEARAIHGGLTQSSRLNILSGFHRGRPHILVATDVAARGLDIKNVSHIFNYDIPNGPEDYTHRTGRTARFGKTGLAISLLSREDHDPFRRILKYIEIEKGELGDFKPKPHYPARPHRPHQRPHGMQRRPRRRY